jgi:tRNA threonylcarbamoyladenosine biosynthesis protein TsaB
MEEAGIALADLSAVAVSGGPGSYTALRIGLSTAKGICYALRKPLIAIDTLSALAGQAQREYPREGALYAPMIDARRMEVYLGLFDANLQPLMKPEAAVLEPGLFDSWSTQLIIGCGNGAPKALEVFSSIPFQVAPVICSAAHLILPALEAFSKSEFADLAYYEPFYLKPPNITTPRKGAL